MIAAILISGRVDLNRDIKGTLERLRLRKKYACVVFSESKEKMGMLKRVEQYVAYGNLDNETLKELIAKRGKLAGNKPIDGKDIDAAVEKIGKGDFGNIKPFFRLHPPIKGFKKKTSFLYPRGVLGNHGGKINELIRRMI